MFAGLLQQWIAGLNPCRRTSKFEGFEEEKKLREKTIVSSSIFSEATQSHASEEEIILFNNESIDNVLAFENKKNSSESIVSRFSERSVLADTIF